MKEKDLIQEQPPLDGIPRSQPHTYEPVAHAAALPLAAPRWIEELPLVLAFAGFMGLGLVGSRLGVTWPTMRATFGMPLDAISSLLIAQLIGSVVVSASSGQLTARLNIGVMAAWSCGIIAVALLGAGVTSSWAGSWC